MIVIAPLSCSSYFSLASTKTCSSITFILLEQQPSYQLSKQLQNRKTRAARANGSPRRCRSRYMRARYILFSLPCFPSSMFENAVQLIQTPSRSRKRSPGPCLGTRKSDSHRQLLFGQPPCLILGRAYFNKISNVSLVQTPVFLRLRPLFLRLWASNI